MVIENILAQLDEEIARLQEVRKLLAATGKVKTSAPAAKAKPGRKPAAVAEPKAKKAKRVLSPEARKAIADAQRKRWAAQKANS